MMHLTDEQVGAIHQRANEVADAAMPRPEDYAVANEAAWDDAERIAYRAFEAEVGRAMTELGGTVEDFWTASEDREKRAEADYQVRLEAAEAEVEAGLAPPF